MIKGLLLGIMIISLLYAECAYAQNTMLKFTRILGFDMAEARLGDIKKKLGNAPIKSKGDASEGSHSMCYFWPSDDITLEFHEFEVGMEFVVRKYKGSDRKECALISMREIGKQKPEVAGLRLGLTQAEVQELIGKPERHTSNSMYFQSRRRLRVTQKELMNNPNWQYDPYFFREIQIKTIFRDSVLIEFSVYKSEQQ